MWKIVSGNSKYIRSGDKQKNEKNLNSFAGMEAFWVFRVGLFFLKASHLIIRLREIIFSQALEPLKGLVW